MSVSLDYGKEYRPITAPEQHCSATTLKKQSKGKQYKDNRRRRIAQFFQDFPNCYYCGTRLTIENRSLDHFIPRSKGGIGSLDNLVTACKDCNQKKGVLVLDVGPHSLAVKAANLVVAERLEA